jgi:hypothetical protein
MRSDKVFENASLPITDRVSVAHDVLCEKITMDADEAFGMLGATHVVDIGFPCAVESCEVGSPESV